MDASTPQSDWLIKFDDFVLCCTAIQFQIIRDVVMNLILYQQPMRAAHSDSLQNMVYMVQLGRIKPDYETLSALQSRLRMLLEDISYYKCEIYKVREWERIMICI